MRYRDSGALYIGSPGMMLGETAMLDGHSRNGLPRCGLGAKNLARNPALPAAASTWVDAGTFTQLRQLRNEASSFELIAG